MHTSPGTPANPIGAGNPPATVAPHYRWTDLTYLLHRAHVSWRYYVFTGTEPDCQQDQQITCPPVHQDAKTRSIWNPLLWFSTVHQDRQVRDIVSLPSVQGVESCRCGPTRTGDLDPVSPSCRPNP